jgi:hypothetical protein
MTVTDEVADQIDRPIEFGRDGYDPDVGSCCRNLIENFRTGELAVGRSSRQPQAIERLSAMVLRADEVAFEMSGKDARCGGRRPFRSGPADLCQQPPQHGRPAGNRRRTKCSDTKPRKTLRDRTNRIFSVERIRSLDAVNVNVDEPGHDEMTSQIELSVTPDARCNLGDDATVDGERARTDNAIGQDDVGPREKDHADSGGDVAADWFSCQ